MPCILFNNRQAWYDNLFKLFFYGLLFVNEMGVKWKMILYFMKVQTDTLTRINQKRKLNYTKHYNVVPTNDIDDDMFGMCWFLIFIVLCKFVYDDNFVIKK